MVVDNVALGPAIGGVRMRPDITPGEVLDLGGARVVIQGFGAVGWHAARLLAGRGATIIAVSDSRGRHLEPRRPRYHGPAHAQDLRRAAAEFPGGTAVPRDDIIGLDCELLVPAAQPDVVTTDNAAKVQARVILQGANIPVTAQAEAQLAGRGVLCVPDVIANAGGVICAAAEYRGAGHAEAFTEIREKIRDSTAELLDRLQHAPSTPRAAASQMADERLRKALALRRKF